MDNLNVCMYCDYSDYPIATILGELENGRESAGDKVDLEL